MDDAVALTELVMRYFAEELAQQNSVGEALQRAKQHYLSGAPSGGFGTYDEKVMIETTLYGLPMYRVTRPLLGAQTSAEPAVASLPLAPAQATALSPYPVSITPSLQLVTATVGNTIIGNYFAVNGEIQTNPGRPTQPRLSQELPVQPGLTPHGALFQSGRITLVANFNPLISRPVTDTALGEPAFYSQAWYPLKPFAVNLLGATPRLVVVPAQYQGNEKSGVEQLYPRMDLVVYYADAGQTDFVAPSLWEVDSVVFKGTTTFKVLAQDDSGIERVVVTWRQDGPNWQSADLTYNSLTGLWEGSLVGVGKEADYFVQAVDKAGNVSMTANKGLFFHPEEHRVFLPLVVK
jgi:hypothetical protein